MEDELQKVERTARSFLKMRGLSGAAVQEALEERAFVGQPLDYEEKLTRMVVALVWIHCGGHLRCAVKAVGDGTVVERIELRAGANPYPKVAERVETQYGPAWRYAR